MVSGLTEPQLKTVRSTYSLPWTGSCVKSSKPRQWSLTGQILQAVVSKIILANKIRKPRKVGSMEEETCRPHWAIIYVLIYNVPTEDPGTKTNESDRFLCSKAGWRHEVKNHILIFGDFNVHLRVRCKVYRQCCFRESLWNKRKLQKRTLILVSW